MGWHRRGQQVMHDCKKKNGTGRDSGMPCKKHEQFLPFLALHPSQALATRLRMKLLASSGPVWSSAVAVGSPVSIAGSQGAGRGGFIQV